MSIMVSNQQSDGSTALYFMPDISGFSQFVSQTEIEHSLHITQELFQILICANNLNLELVEIEGDALFFYTHGRHPFPKVESQIQVMLQAFHNHIAKYEKLRICNCGACVTAVKLKLKFILHIGSLHFLNVSGHKKPFGHHVNLIHRLLKNEVPLTQYYLLSENAWNHFRPSDTASYSKKTTSMDIGELTYYYKKLSTPVVRKKTSASKQVGFFERGQNPNVEVSRIIEAPSDLLFEYVSNLQKRNQWDLIPTKLEFEKQRINRAGINHQCIIGSRVLRFQTGKITPKKEAEQIYTEYTGDLPFLRRYQYYILLEPMSTGKTLVKILIYFDADLLGKVAWHIFLKRRLRRNWERKLDQLAVILE